MSGYSKLFTFPLADPSKKTQLTFGTFEDSTPVFSGDGTRIYYSSNEDDEIYNLRSLDLRTGAIEQYTDALGGNMAPVTLRGRTGSGWPSSATPRGSSTSPPRTSWIPMKEVDQDVRPLTAEILDFQPDVVHQVVSENKRSKKLFEKLFLEGRPPINVGVTSGGDFFGGSQVALTDVLGDQNFTFTALSVASYRTYLGSYVNLAKRLHFGINGFDTTSFFYGPNAYYYTGGFSRQGVLATQRYSGGTFIGQYPLDKYRRLDMTAGVIYQDEKYDDPALEAQVRAQYAQAGIPFYLNTGFYTPLGLTLVQETTRFASFGPLSGSTFSIGGEVSLAGLKRRTLDADLRKYLRIGSTSMILAARARGFYSSGDDPQIFYFGGNQELRGYPYLSFSGNEGFFANLELRLPVINLAATPLGVIGPLRGTLFAGMGGAKYRGQQYQFSTSSDGRSYVKDPVFGEPVSGFHLVDGRASYGIGLQLFFLGYPLHFDWSKLTDLKVSAEGTQFDFWIGFDF